MKEKLSPCPFCGKEGEQDIVAVVNNDWYVRCTCGARSSYEKSRENAIRRWNREEEYFNQKLCATCGHWEDGECRNMASPYWTQETLEGCIEYSKAEV